MQERSLRTKTHIKPKKTDHPTIAATVETWHFLFQNTSLTEHTQSVHPPVEVFNFLLPDLSPKHWSNIKSLQLKELIHNDQLLPFQTLKTRYLIPSQGAYTYKHIASYLKKNPAPSVIIPTKAWSSWTSNSPKAKGITLMYNLLKNKDKFTKTSTYKRWERDLQASFSDSQWRTTTKHPPVLFIGNYRKKSTIDDTLLLYKCINLQILRTTVVGEDAPPRVR